jgi:hypothetical protein
MVVPYDERAAPEGTTTWSGAGFVRRGAGNQRRFAQIAPGMREGRAPPLAAPLDKTQNEFGVATDAGTSLREGNDRGEEDSYQVCSEDGPNRRLCGGERRSGR